MRGGAGIGFRPEIAADLLTARGSVDLLELLFESSTASTRARREAVAFSRVFPVVVHGVKLSLGSAEGIDLDRAARLGAFAREVGASLVSEHVSFVRAGGREIGHLTALPFSRETVRVVARNVAAARRVLPDVPFLLENVAWGFRPPGAAAPGSGDEMDEGDFHAEIVWATGCELLLDVANLLANARNAGLSPRALLEQYPLDAVAQVHVAGGAWDHTGFWLDTHGHPVDVEVFELLARVHEVAGEVPVVLERDEDFRFSQLVDEVRVARAAGVGAGLGAAPRAGRTAASASLGYAPGGAPRGRADDERARTEGLAHGQALLASALGGDGDGGLSRVELARARGVLRGKRVEAAVSLLPRASASQPELPRLAREVLAERPLAPRHGAAHDALALSEVLVTRGEHGVRAAAALDRATLLARFVRRDQGLERRFAPSVSRVRVGGLEAWVVKGLGRHAEVRVVTRMVGGVG